MFSHIEWLQFSIKIASHLCCLLFYHICLFPLPHHFQLDPHFSFSAMIGEIKSEARRVLSKNIQDYLLGWHLAVKPKSRCSNPSNMRCCACSAAGIKPLFCKNWVEIGNCYPHKEADWEVWLVNVKHKNFGKASPGHNSVHMSYSWVWYVSWFLYST